MQREPTFRGLWRKHGTWDIIFPLYRGSLDAAQQMDGQEDPQRFEIRWPPEPAGL